jgi:hypothetical protein
MYPVGFEPAIPAKDKPQTHALDGAANRIAEYHFITINCGVIME